MSSTTGMSETNTAKGTSEDDKVNWFAEIRGLALMILAVLVNEGSEHLRLSSLYAIFCVGPHVVKTFVATECCCGGRGRAKTSAS